MRAITVVRGQEHPPTHRALKALTISVVAVALVVGARLLGFASNLDQLSVTSPTVVPSGVMGESPAVPLTRSTRTGIVMASVTSNQAIENALVQTNATDWLNYEAPSVEGPIGRAQMIRTGANRAALAPGALREIAVARPGSLWVIGNEPNIIGQDYDPTLSLAKNAEAYVQVFRAARSEIIDADPSARFVIGNVMNLDAVCAGCEGQITGRAFLDLVAAAYGEVFPPDVVWGVHAYEIDWDRLPTTRVEQSIAEISAFRAYVDSLAGQTNKPIVVTELGVIWGFPNLCWEGDVITGCGSDIDAPAVEGYLDAMIGWLRRNRQALSIERWFVFANYANPEPFAASYGGIALMDGPDKAAKTTRFGELIARLNATPGD